MRWRRRGTLAAQSAPRGLWVVRSLRPVATSPCGCGTAARSRRLWPVGAPVLPSRQADGSRWLLAENDCPSAFPAAHRPVRERHAGCHCRDAVRWQLRRRSGNFQRWSGRLAAVRAARIRVGTAPDPCGANCRPTVQTSAENYPNDDCRRTASRQWHPACRFTNRSMRRRKGRWAAISTSNHLPPTACRDGRTGAPCGHNLRLRAAVAAAARRCRHGVKGTAPPTAPEALTVPQRPPAPPARCRRLPLREIWSNPKGPHGRAEPASPRQTPEPSERCPQCRPSASVARMCLSPGLSRAAPPKTASAPWRGKKLR